MSNLKEFLNKKIDIRELITGKVATKDLAIFFRQLSIMFSANLKISEIFKVLLNQKDSKLNNVVRKISDKLEEGYKLSEAMDECPEVFNKYQISILRSGELTGNLDESLDFLSEELEDNYDLINKVKSALTYPLFILVAMFIVIAIIVMYVVPTMTQVLSETGGDLPLVTKIVMFISNFLVSNSIFIIISFIILVICTRMYYNTSKGKEFFDKFILKIPVFGSILKKLYISKIARSLFVLIRSSVPIVESFEITSEISNNKVYKDILTEIGDKVKNGEKISIAFSEYKQHFSSILIEMISVGEETGKLDYMMQKVYILYSKELKNTTNSISSIIEPVIMVLLGIIVAIIVAAVLLPMYSLSSQI